jgi:tetratricopeptide (TPR) repeat protein
LSPSARRQLRKDPRKSQTELKAARRELVRGNNEKALLLLCSATGHFAANVGAWQTLAELSLHQGDAEQAKQAVEQALKRKPNDPTLLGILGDAFALLGDLKRSRSLWAQSAKVTGSEAERARRLAAAFGANGDRQLRAWSHGGALVYYRRAAVLSAGSHASSVGMGEALRRLGQTQAQAAWVARASNIAPPDARSPILP